MATRTCPRCVDGKIKLRGTSFQCTSCNGTGIDGEPAYVVAIIAFFITLGICLLCYALL